MAEKTSACLVFACCICGVSAFSSLAQVRVLSQARRSTCHFRIPFSSKMAGAVEGEKKLKKPTLFQGEVALSDVPRTMQVSNVVNTPICTQTQPFRALVQHTHTFTHQFAHRRNHFARNTHSHTHSPTQITHTGNCSRFPFRLCRVLTYDTGGSATVLPGGTSRTSVSSCSPLDNRRGACGPRRAAGIGRW
jgi:hypothetical protein